MLMTAQSAEHKEIQNDVHNRCRKQYNGAWHSR